MIYAQSFYLNILLKTSMTSPVIKQGVKEKNVAPLVMVLLWNIHVIPACY